MAAEPVRAAKQLRQQGRWDEAERLPADAVAGPSPSDDTLAEYSWAAHLRKDWPEAARRWERHRKLFPDQFLGYGMGSVALREAGRLDDAELVANEGARRFPGHPEIAANLAWIAHGRRDWPEALRRWRRYIHAFPDHMVGYSGAGWALREMYSFDEADATLLEGLRRHPDNPELLANYAWSAYKRMDWKEALRRWTAYSNRFPDQSIGDYQVAAVLRQLGDLATAEEAAQRAALKSAQVDTAKLMLRFESLGDNCEFGIVQRHFGADPLGLLRFTNTPWRSLKDALEARFDGVGQPENTKLLVVAGEYMTTDTRFHMGMHTFVRDGGEDRDEKLRSFCRRLEFLREKMIRDLSEGDKIFVYGCSERLGESDALSLWSALQSCGDNRLLLVQEVDADHSSTEARMVRDSLIIGYIPKFNVEAPDFSAWLKLSQRALGAFGW